MYTFNAHAPYDALIWILTERITRRVCYVVLRINKWKYPVFYCIICHSIRFID